MDREREEKIATIQLLATVIGRGLGVAGEALDGMLRLYRQEVTQVRYRPETLAAIRRNMAQQTAKRRSDETLLKKVEKLTVPDSELPPLPKKPSRRRRA